MAPGPFQRPTASPPPSGAVMSLVLPITLPFGGDDFNHPRGTGGTAACWVIEIHADREVRVDHLEWHRECGIEFVMIRMANLGGSDRHANKSEGAGQHVLAQGAA